MVRPARPSPRIINVSFLNNILPGATVSTSSVITGATEKSVLIRAVGPSLATRGASGTSQASPCLRSASSTVQE